MPISSMPVTGRRLLFLRQLREEEKGYFLHPVIRSIILHFWLAYDHPFADGNGRTARMLFYWKPPPLASKLDPGQVRPH